VSDGTATGTRPLTRFLAPGPFNDVPVFFEDIDGILHFLADDVTGGLDLWRSDGTETGTRRVTAFGNARPFSGAFERQIVKLGSRLLFIATDGLTGFRLWSSGGTPQTTAPVTGCPGGSCPLAGAALVKLDGKAVFLGSRPGGNPAVWSSDGTGSGTRSVRDLCLGHCSAAPAGLAAHLDQAYFLARSPERTFELWRTDGTQRGTLRLADLGDFASFPPVALRGRILFTADGPRDNAQLWASDGTPEGTGPLTWLHGGGSGSEPHDFRSDGGTVWFRAVDGQDASFWRSAGTAATTEKTALAGEHAVLARGFAFFALFEGGFEGLARTDGTPGGTLPLTPAEGYLRALVAFGDGVAAVFEMPDGALAFWRSDGSLAGTRRLPDLPASLGFPVRVIPVGPELFFIGNDSVWRSDGTPGDMRPVHLRQRDFEPETLVRLGNRVFFVGRSQAADRRIWKIEGAIGSPQLLLPLDSPSCRSPSNLAVFRGALYFLAQTESLETGLWSSDGTAAGTVLLKEFPSQFFTSAPPDEVEFVAIGERLFFPFDTEADGGELWSTDGTPEGTVLVRDIVPGPGSSSPSHLAAAGDRLFFAAADEDHGIELWESDGTEAGTRMVHDIAPGVPSSQPEELTVANGRLFFAADDGVHGREPWVLPLAQPGCQATAEALCLGGRFRVEAFWRDFQGNFGPGRAVPLTADTGYFWFFDPANVEVIVKALDGQGLNGHHWVFYGALSTVEYTLTVTDTQTGAARRYINPPGRLGSVGDTTAFGPLGAIGSATSLGPAAIEHKPIATARMTEADAAAVPCVASPTRLCLQGGRFAVEADWRDFQGNTGKGMAVPLPGGDTGYFWFFGADNVEVVLKVLDGRPLTGKFWVFYGALSSVQYTLTVTDTETGKVKKYENPSGRLASVADTGAF
jgi:ELWxxDGT repeat protein